MTTATTVPASSESGLLPASSGSAPQDTTPTGSTATEAFEPTPPTPPAIPQHPDLKTELDESPGEGAQTGSGAPSQTEAWDHQACDPKTGPTRERDEAVEIAHAADIPDSVLRIPGYRCERRLGRGGEGETFEVVDLQLNNRLAMKVPSRLDSASQSRFLREAQKAAKVQHPNVVGIGHFGRHGDRVYFTMPLIEGPNCAHLVKGFRADEAHRRGADVILKIARVDRAQLDPAFERICRARRPYYRMVALWMADAAQGVHAVHHKEILHRDIKPANLLMNADGRLVVADFGLAMTNEDLTGKGRGVSGTYPYVAPERVIGDHARIDHRADIWALGATLYEFLAYRRAYATDGAAVLQEIAVRDCPSPRSVRPSVPPELEQICAKAMRRDPAQRYSTAQEMANDLRRWAMAPAPRRLAWATAAVALLAAAVATAYTFPEATRRTMETVLGSSEPEPVPPVVLVSLQSLRAEPEQLVLNRELGLATSFMVHGVMSDGTARPISKSECAFSYDGPLPPIAELEGDTMVAKASGQAAFEIRHGGRSLRFPVLVELGAVGPPPYRIMLATNEDLNAVDELPLRSGGVVEQMLREKFRAQTTTFELVEASRPVERWTFDTALEAARGVRADYLLYTSLVARPQALRPLHLPMGRIGLEEVGIREWRLTLETRVVSLATGNTEYSHSEFDTPPRDDREFEMGGGAPAKLARKVIEKLDRDFVQVLRKQVLQATAP